MYYFLPFLPLISFIFGFIDFILLCNFLRNLFPCYFLLVFFFIISTIFLFLLSLVSSFVSTFFSSFFHFFLLLFFCLLFSVFCCHNSVDTSSCLFTLSCYIPYVLLVQNFVKICLLYTNLNTHKHE